MTDSNQKHFVYGASVRHMLLFLLVAIVVFWLISYLILTALWGEVIFSRLLFIAVPLGLISLAGRYFQERGEVDAATRSRKADERRKEILGNYRATTGFDATRSFFAYDEDVYLVVDERLGKVTIGKSDDLYSADVLDIRGVRVLQDGASILGSSLQSVAAGAAIGGVAFGQAGAIAGALIGQAADVVSSVSIEITLSLETLTDFELCLLSERVASGSERHKEAANLAESIVRYLGHAKDDAQKGS